MIMITFLIHARLMSMCPLSVSVSVSRVFVVTQVLSRIV